MPEGWLSIKQAAEHLHVSRKLIYRLYGKGDLVGSKIGGTIRLRQSSLDAYLDRHSNRSTPPGDQPMSTPRRRKKDADDFTSYYLREMERIEAAQRRKEQKAKRS